MSAENTPKPRMRLWLRVVLVLSLAFNLVIIGGATGVALRFGRFGPPPSHMEEGRGSPMIMALSRDARREMGRSIRKAYRDTANDAGNESGIYADLVRALEADPFDKEALRAARQALESRMSLRREVAGDVWLESISKMGVTERKAYAESMLEILTRKKSWRPRGAKADH